MRVLVSTCLVLFPLVFAGCAVQQERYSALVAPKYCADARSAVGAYDWPNTINKINKRLQSNKLTKRKCLDVLNQKHSQMTKDQKEWSQFAGFQEVETRPEDLDDPRIKFYGDDDTNDLTEVRHSSQTTKKSDENLKKSSYKENSTSWLEDISKVPSILSVDLQGNALIVFPKLSFPKASYLRLVKLLCVSSEKQGFSLVRIMNTQEFLSREKYKVFERYSC